jgi:hypothetical protein
VSPFAPIWPCLLCLSANFPPKYVSIVNMESLSNFSQT